jgi:hypothetical protein
MMTREQPCILAIDPGRVKCGVAVVGAEGTVHFRTVVPTESLCAEVASSIASFAPIAVIVGCGTGCKEMIRRIEEAASPLPVSEVEEAHTSEEARKRWVLANPPTGFQRLMPQSLRCPDVPYDDYVAVILAERWWHAHPTLSRNETSS